MALLAQLSASFPGEVWLLLGGLAIGALLAMLHTVAACFRGERELHDLKLRVVELRGSYAARLQGYRDPNDASASFTSGREFVDDADVIVIQQPVSSAHAQRGDHAPQTHVEAEPQTHVEHARQAA